jgi:hypothetical protein
MKKLAFVTILAGTCFVPVHAGNVVLNPGFETGDFTSWSVNLATQGPDLHVRSGGVSPGLFDTEFGATTVGDYDTLAQSITTVSGQVYTFGFSLAESFGGGEGSENLSSGGVRPAFVAADPVADFQAFWNGTMVLDEPAAGRTGFFDFNQFAFDEVATGNDIITFRAYNVPSFYSLDNVSVSTTAATATPEPATWLAMTVGLAALALLRLKLTEERIDDRKCTPSSSGLRQPL